jgi:protein-S-isoprenylcysteine O-methyltransferase Ste14
MLKEKRPLIFNGFGLLASIFILLSGAVIPNAIVDIMVQVFGLLLIIWAAVTIKMNKDKQTQTLPKGYFFLTKGPYEIIRHPVYAGYLLIMISICEVEFTFLRFIALIILCAAVMLKIIREEYTMTQVVPEYKEYKLKTKAIIPYVL